MKAEYDVLVEFKKAKDIEEKQAMIDSFYMLSDEDKKDVQDNIENYSLEDIEAKLSIICVHNKLDLSEKKETEQAVETTFSLADDDNDEDFSAPAWVSLLRRQRKN
jgi:tRNA U34 5-carboxymethylaminomethyl modifying GTPase MnmE/TrmE